MFLLKGLWAVCLLDFWLLSSAQMSAETFRDAANSFSLDLLKELSGDATDNLIFAPLSVSTLLAIVQQGARNNSARQLESVLRLSQEDSKQGYGRLSRSIKEARNISTALEVANGVFVRQGLVLIEDFENTVREDFQSDVQPVSFGSGEELVTINSWVSEATHGRIPAILDSALQSDTTLVLVNAVYFNSSWLYKFKHWETYDQNFSRSPESVVTVPTMHIDDMFKAGENTELGFKWVELPFHPLFFDIVQDENYSMVIAVPNKKNGLKEMLRNLTHEDLRHFSQNATRRMVSLSLPRFKMNSKINLEEPLMHLGLTDIFSQLHSDLSGITPSGNLVVSKAVQKADIEVSEDGATAAAATAVILMPASAFWVHDPFVITADHPFLAMITDTRKLIHFCAIVADPLV